MRLASPLALCAILIAACSGADDGATTTSATTTAVTGSLKLTEIARLDQPLDLAVRPGDPHLYIAEKGGRVQRVAPDGAVTTALDISDEVTTGGEQGLLGITFSPDGGKLYIHFTDVDGDTRLEEVDPDGDVSRRRLLLAVDQPYPNHNGGRIAFGPDGKLYLGLGDGGGGGDPNGNGQDPDALLGKILRIDPATPETPERYAIGLRNPWRFSFDRDNGDLWVGDVGQNEWEEIDRIPAGTPAGVNLGWNLLEGSHAYEGGAGGMRTLAPVHEYDHDSGESVVGGYVYRGAKMPQLHGTYLFADTYRGPIRTLRLEGGAYVARDTQVEVPGGQPVSFGEDAEGELYVISLSGGVYRIDPS